MIFVILFLPVASFAENIMIHKFVDKKVAGISIGDFSEEKAVKLYGKGVQIQGGYAFCYYNQREKSFLVLELGPDKFVESIIIVKEDCMEHLNTCRSKQIDATFQTGKGIRMGDSPEKVINIYGEPEKKEIKDGVQIFEYHSDYKKDPQVTLAYDAYLHFRNGKLVKLIIHDGD